MPVVMVAVVVGRPGPAPVVSVVRCRVGPWRPRSSAFERQRVASPRRRPTAVHLLPQRFSCAPRSTSGCVQRSLPAETAGSYTLCINLLVRYFSKTLGSQRYDQSVRTQTPSSSSSDDRHKQTGRNELLPPQE